jgi:polyisoprenoid-binding protein YceI
MKYSWLFLLSLFLNVSWAQDTYQDLPSGIYRLDNTHASLLWKVSHLGLSNYTARFTRFDATIDFNAEDLTQSQVSATIDPLSIKTDYPYAEEKDFDKKLSEGEDWFDGLNFPEIRFNSNKIIMKDNKSGIMQGDLTFLGVTKPVEVSFTLNGAMKVHPFAKKAALGFSAQAVLLRSEWGMDIYIPNIGDAVTVLIEAEFLEELEE